MVGADQGLALRTGLAHHPGAAVLADIVKHPDLAVMAVDQHQGLAGNGHRVDVAGFGNLVAVSRQHPGAGEQAVVLELEEGLAGIGRIGQGQCRLDRLVELIKGVGAEKVQEHLGRSRVR